MLGDQLAAKPMICYPIRLDNDLLASYQRQLGLRGPGEAALALARAIAVSPMWGTMPPVVLSVRTTPQPVVAVLGHINPDTADLLAAQDKGLRRACRDLRFVNYRQVEMDCQVLANKLVERFGLDQLAGFHFEALPRGGYIVLGILAYLMNLEKWQLGRSSSFDKPLVVVDDCVITGVRVAEFLERCNYQQVILAHLYSHPDLRASIRSEERRVVDCINARDFRDHGVDRMGDEYDSWRRQWSIHMPQSGYWFGLVEHISFPWNEPDRSVLNPATGKSERGWYVLPPDLCLEHQALAGKAEIPVQVQPEGKGPLKPADNVVFGELDGQILLANLTTGESFGLSEVAADMWRAVVEHGNSEDVVIKLLKEYDVDEVVLRIDLQAFIGDLLSRGILVQGEDT